MRSPAPAAPAAGAGARAQLRVGWLSDVLLTWLTPLMFQGYATPFVLTALPRLPLEDDAAHLLERFQGCWERAREGVRPFGHRARTATIDLLTPRIQLVALWQIISIATEATQPIIIRILVRDLRLGVSDLALDFGLVGLLVLSAVVSTITLQQVFWVSSRLGMRAKIALSAAVYAKTLRLSHSALLNTSAGRATNLVAIDVNRLELAFTYLHFLWSVPAVLATCGTLIGVQVGEAAAAGLGFLVALFAVQRLVSTRMGRLRQLQAAQTDRRVKMMNDVLSGVEGLKVNGWEAALISRVEQRRAHEQSLLKHSLSLLSMMEACVFFAPGLATFIVLVVDRYALGNSIEIEQAFAMLGLFNLLTKQFNVLPRALKSLDESMVSFKRVESFLNLPEIANVQEHRRKQDSPRPVSSAEVSFISPPLAVATTVTEVSAAGVSDEEASRKALETGARTARADVDNKMDRHGLWLRDVSADWGGVQGKEVEASASVHSRPTARPDSDSALITASVGPPATGDRFQLSSINISVNRGEMCLLVGSVGSGKSSLIQLILREMPLLQGEIGGSALEDSQRLGSGIGYAPQKSWILNATLRENILLGRRFEEEWYKEVLERCAITHDLTLMPQGDSTEIGEKGVTISGGQKARISLARAVYGRPKLLLLDDPLSAVDQNVARHLLNHLFTGLLKPSGATVLLVTHQVQYVSELADLVVLLEAGRVKASGTVSEVTAREALGLVIPIAELRTTASLEAVRTNEEVGVGTKSDSPRAPANGACGGSTGIKGSDAEVQVGEVAKVAKRETSEAAAREMGLSESRCEALTFFIAQVGWLASLVVVLLFVGLGVCRAMADWALGTWIRDGQKDSDGVLYSALTSATVALGLLQAAMFADRAIAAATRAHSNALNRVLHAPKSFFDTTPLGSVIAVFSKDLDSLDELMPVATINLLKCVCIVASSMIVCATAVPAALGVAPPLLLVFRKLTTFYQRTADQLKRLDKATSGPVYSSYAEALNGLTSLRAFGLARSFEHRLVNQLALNHSAHFLWHASGRWFAVRLDALTALVIAAVGCCVLLFRDSLDPTLAALALTYVIQMASLFQWGFRLWAEVLNHFISVERFLAYTRLPQEAASVQEGDKRLAESNWPRHGSITFEGVQMRYRVTLPLVLRNVSFTVKGGSKTALVGRTGAGKSSVALALARVCELESGDVMIDGINLRSVGLRLLRGALTFIQQDTVLFSGTIRSNLDPLHEHDDGELQRALEAVNFSRHAGVEILLHQEVAESGSDLSAGMRQLLVLARALLRHSRIVILDEATANVDFSTDGTMQQLIRSEFANSTILTIAHRLETIIDYDFIILMSNGHVAESGPPNELLKAPQSLFSNLVKDAGEHASVQLRAAAGRAASV